MSLNQEDTESSTTCETQIVGGDPEQRSYVAFQDEAFMDAFSRNSLSFPSHQKFLATRSETAGFREAITLFDSRAKRPRTLALASGSF